MRSTEGRHYAGLDHLRGLAAFLVVFWHFAHGAAGPPVPVAQSPWMGLLDEGHSGVALFMTLSGYLFARLIAGRSVRWSAFFWNRAIRLLPLLLLSFLLVGLLKTPLGPADYLLLLARGLVFPVWPHGGWSITAEIHFYLLLPLLLWGCRRWPSLPLLLVAAAVLLRSALWLEGHDIQQLAYYTLVGRIDHFLLGMFVASRLVRLRLMLLCFGALWLGYAAFTAAGGFYSVDRPWLWILLPTLEAVGFAALIAWYDRHPLSGRLTRPLEWAGTYSYSIYLLHFFSVAPAVEFVERHILDLQSIAQALPFALVYFAYMMGLGWICHRFVEQPAMRFRRPYIRGEGVEIDRGARPVALPA